MTDVFELVIPYGTKEDYEWAVAMLERAWYDVGIDPDGHHWVSAPS